MQYTTFFDIKAVQYCRIWINRLILLLFFKSMSKSGIEPLTRGFSVHCSTSELYKQILQYFLIKSFKLHKVKIIIFCF